MAGSKGWESGTYRAVVSVLNLRTPWRLHWALSLAQCTSAEVGTVERSITHSTLLLVAWFGQVGEHQPMSPYMDITPPRDLGHLCRAFALLAARVEQCTVTTA